MKLGEAILECDKLKPNQYETKDKIKWISDLDGIIKKDIIDTHEGWDAITYTPYDENTNMDTVLLATAPYDDMYVQYLFSKIDFYNSEMARYNNSILMFNNQYSDYAKYYNRTVMPLQKNDMYVAF